MHLCGLEVLETQPVFVDSLKNRKCRERQTSVSKDPLQLITYHWYCANSSNLIPSALVSWQPPTLRPLPWCTCIYFPPLHHPNIPFTIHRLNHIVFCTFAAYGAFYAHRTAESTEHRFWHQQDFMLVFFTASQSKINAPFCPLNMFFSIWYAHLCFDSNCSNPMAPNYPFVRTFVKLLKHFYNITSGRLSIIKPSENKVVKTALFINAQLKVTLTVHNQFKLVLSKSHISHHISQYVHTGIK